MKKKFLHQFLPGILICMAVLSLLPSGVFAAGPSMYVAPPLGTSQVGNTFTISVDGDVPASAFGTHSASGTISFPSNILKVTNINANGSTFPDSTVTPNNNAGTISFSQGCPWWCAANNQTVHFFTVTFQSLAAGSAKVNFTGASYDGYAAGSTGGSYTVNAVPVPTPTPTPTPSPRPSTSVTPKPTVTPKPSATPTPTPTPTPAVTPSPEETPAPEVESDGGLKISNVKVIATRLENSVSFAVNNAKATPTI
jgi:hypothetical protein